MKTLGRTFVVACVCAAAYLAFSDVVFYWTGLGSSRIAKIDMRELTFLRDERIRFGGPGVHFKQVKYFRTQEGTEVTIFQTDSGVWPQVFVRGQHKIFLNEGFEEVTTLEPFVPWSYLLKRCALLFILILMIFTMAGLGLKLLGVRVNSTRQP